MTPLTHICFGLGQSWLGNKKNREFFLEEVMLKFCSERELGRGRKVGGEGTDRKNGLCEDTEARERLMLSVWKRSSTTLE